MAKSQSDSWPTSHPGWAGRRVKRCVLSGWGAAASSMQLFMYLSFPKRRDSGKVWLEFHHWDGFIGLVLPSPPWLA